MKQPKSIFFLPKNKALAKKVSIVSPEAFRRSIKTLQKGGLMLGEKRALVLAQNRARAILNKRNLSHEERVQFSRIAKMRLPKLTHKKR